ncbi:MAG: PulJ/GspJ family protein [Minisyncoccia bacterium]
MIFKQNNGFTLVELLVAISVFAIAVSIGGSFYFSALHSSRNINSFDVMLSNVKDAIEMMARDLRTGSGLTATNCASSTSFIDINNNPVTYKVSNGILYKNNIPLTPSSVQILSQCFIVRQDVLGGPFFITIQMKIGAPGIKQTVNLQTSVSTRIIPILDKKTLQ